MHARAFLVKNLCPNCSSKGIPFICVPSGDPQGSLVSVQSGQMWGETLDIKDTLLPFMTILRAGPDPEALVRLQFPPSRTINSLLTDYSQNYSCFRYTPPLLAKINSVTHLDWSYKAPGVLQKNHSYFVNMSWGWCLRNRLFRCLQFHLAPKLSQGTPSSTSAPMLPPR
jgi:hypothetical protein